MLRVNLLPKEILERRRYEKWYGWVILIGVALLALVVLAGAMFWLMGQQRNDQLQQLQEDSQKYQQQADSFSIFEKKEQELQSREKIAQDSLSGRINMGSVANEVSLVLPDEVWLQSMAINQETGLTLTGNTPQNPSQSMDIGYKSVAKTLVRLNQLTDLHDLWLTSAANGNFSAFQPSASVPATVVVFTITGKVTKPSPPAAQTPGTAVPAPPSAPAQ